MLEDSKAVLLLTSKKYHNQYQSNTKELLIEDLWQTMPGYPSTAPEVDVNGADLAYILYTSGSTGMPKGVQIAHHNLVNFLISMQNEPGFTANDKLLAVTTVSFDIAGLELFLPLLSGGEIVIADAVSAKDGRVLLDLIKKEKVNVMQATPYTWRMLLEAGWDKSTPLKIICGGEALPIELAHRLIDIAGSLWNVYGPTETTIWSTVKKITAADTVISIGRPIRNTYIYILDKFLNPLAPGAAGEIYIGGEGVAKGYLNRTELTAEKFIDDPFSKHTGEKMYRTGDLGKFLPSGEIECLGRIDAQVKIRGYRIETGEIEFQLSKEGAIKEAVVIARPDKSGIDKLVAFIVTANLNGASSAASQNIQSWKDALKSSLPDYMIPDNFVIIQELPLTPNGKIDKKALLKHKIVNEEIEGNNFVAPNSALEKLIANIWMENFGSKNISAKDNFFELGGHSLLGLRIIASIEKELGKPLPISALFEYPTVEKFAGFLEKAEKKKKSQSLVALKSTGENKPFFIVAGLNGTAFAFVEFANMFDANQPVFLLQEPQAIEDMREFPDSVEGIASTYIDQLLDQQPTGPYALAGHCFGGVIAFEMARQMKNMGKEVKLLALIDADVDEVEKRPAGMNETLFKLKNGTQNVAFILYKNIRLFFHDWKLALKYRKQSFNSFLNKIKKISNPDHRVEAYSFSEKVTQLYAKANENYQVTPCDIDVILFKAKLNSFRYKDEKYYGWKQNVKSIVVHEVKGDHLTMIESKDFAVLLQQTIDSHLNK
jgi:amino acid adenylation domain-containing protein